jgi:hypothetical protein
MKPSSKICLLGVVVVGALWPAGEASAAGRSFGMPSAVHFRPAVRPVARQGHITAVPGARGRFSRGGAFASALPVYWDGTFPAYEPGYGPGADYASAAAAGQVLPSPVFYPFYPPPAEGAAAVCGPVRGPLVIEVAPSKPSRKLPRVVYGTPSWCRG